MKLPTLALAALLMSTLAFATEAQPKKCVFEGFELYNLTNPGQGPFKEIEKAKRDMSLPKIFSNYKKELGDWNASECKGAVRKTQVVSFEDHQVYTLYYTNDDSCDGGNSYGLILGTKEQSPRGDKVVATITDSFINCL